MRTRLVTVLAAIFSLLLGRAEGATVKVASWLGTPHLYIVGPIVSGDYERVRSALHRAGPNVTTVQLRSGGGNLQEGIKIGRLLRSLYLSTRAPVASDDCAYDHEILGTVVTCQCTSACFFIWLGGYSRGGFELYIHRFRYETDQFAKLPPDEARRQYNRDLAAVKEYFTEMDVPDSIYERFVAIRSTRVEKVPEEETYKLMSVPAYQEWIHANCGKSDLACPLRKEEEIRRAAFSTVFGK